MRMVMRNKTTNIYTEWLPLIDSLPNDIAGVIFKNILKYQNGEDINNTFPVWVFIKSKIDDYNKNGETISKIRSEAGKKGMAKRWGISNDSKCYQMITSDNKNNNKIKQNKIKENNNNINNTTSKKVLIDEYFNFGDCEDVREIANEYNEKVLDGLYKFLIGTFMGQCVDVAWIKKQAEKFNEQAI